MNPGSRRRVPTLLTAPALAGAACLLAGCLGMPDLDSGGDAVVVTETGAVSYAPEVSPERAAAVAEMRARAAAGEAAGYPDALQTEQTLRLAAREEPRSVPSAEAVQAELEAIAARRRAATNRQEIAAMEARAAELRRIAAARAGQIRQ